MAIGKLQRTARDEVYIWAQECMTLFGTQLKADLRFPRLNREIAAKLIRACRKGRFGLLSQQQVEQERSRSGGCQMGAACCAPYSGTSSSSATGLDACRTQSP